MILGPHERKSGLIIVDWTHKDLLPAHSRELVGLNHGFHKRCWVWVRPRTVDLLPLVFVLYDWVDNRRSPFSFVHYWRWCRVAIWKNTSSAILASAYTMLWLKSHLSWLSLSDLTGFSGVSHEETVFAPFLNLHNLNYLVYSNLSISRCYGFLVL